MTVTMCSCTFDIFQYIQYINNLQKSVKKMLKIVPHVFMTTTPIPQ